MALVHFCIQYLNKLKYNEKSSLCFLTYMRHRWSRYFYWHFTNNGTRSRCLHDGPVPMFTDRAAPTTALPGLTEVSSKTLVWPDTTSIVPHCFTILFHSYDEELLNHKNSMSPSFFKKLAPSCLHLVSKLYIIHYSNIT